MPVPPISADEFVRGLKGNPRAPAGQAPQPNSPRRDFGRQWAVGAVDVPLAGDSQPAVSSLAHGSYEARSAQPAIPVPSPHGGEEHAGAQPGDHANEQGGGNADEGQETLEALPEPDASPAVAASASAAVEPTPVATAEPAAGREASSPGTDGASVAASAPSSASVAAATPPSSEPAGGSQSPAGAPIAAHDPGAVLESLAQAPPSAAATALAQAQQAAPAALQAQREQAGVALTAIEPPTGLPARDVNDGARDAAPDAQTPAAAKEPLPAAGASASEPAPDALAPEAPPAPPQPATALVGGEQQTDETGQPKPDPELAHSAQGALADVHLASEQIPTTASEHPTLTLDGEADPERLAAARATSTEQTQQAHAEAAGAIGQDFGEHDIYPDRADDFNPPVLPPREPAPPQIEGSAPGALPAEALAAIDAEAAPTLHARVGAEQQRYAEGQASYQADSQAAHEQARADMDTQGEQTRSSQLEAQSSAQTEVEQARVDWQSEIDEVEADFQEKASSAREEHGGRIHGEQEAGNRKAAEHIVDAEREAGREKRKAEAAAGEKKRSAENESKGFWGWARSAAASLIDDLKSAVNAIYDGLRSRAKFIFEKAKGLALAAIELARKAVVIIIQAYGLVLKGLLTIALAAFPEARARAMARIDQAVDKATQLVNAAAEGLKNGVAAVLDFLSSTLDSLLSLVQDLFNGIFIVIGMLISGELQELLGKVNDLREAAWLAFGQFEIAAYEELLGGPLDQPLSPAELMAAGRMPATSTANTPTFANDLATETDADTQLPGPPWTENNVGVDAVATGETLSPELSAQLMQMTGGDGEVTFGESGDESRSLESILGLGAQTAQTSASGHQAETATGGTAYDDGLTPRERAEIKWGVMKQGISDWLAQNWPLVLAGGVLGVAGFIVANILTGGAILAALPVIMTALGPIFGGLLFAQLAGHLRDYLQKSWNGDKEGGGKSLAKGLAAGAIELITALTFKVGSVAMKGARAVAKGAVTGAQAVARGTTQVAKGALGIARRGANYVLKGGKVLLRGAGQGIGQGIKRLDELGERLLQRTRFNGFRARIRGRRFTVKGKINPWLLVIDNQLEEVPRGTPGAKWVDDELWATGRLQRRFQASRRSPSDVSDAKDAKTVRGDALEERRIANQQRQQEHQRLREEAIEKLKHVDQRLENTLKQRSSYGHGHKDHGYQTKLDDHRRRIETGKSPSGHRGRRGSPPTSSAKFYTPEAEYEAFQKARQQLTKELATQKIPSMANGQPNRIHITVHSDHPRGFGGGYKAKQDTNGLRAEHPSGGFQAEKVSRVRTAVFAFEYKPSNNEWVPVTYYPQLN
ncbi:hypothetical protein [Haliangium ochraceum]|uniref:hypothetical protein n=1 Tax=Haliangium ochraceum TaxID=80816 RepID=UPI00126A4843|nr:hypothetical protein [Haliangium ochraceum]